MNLVTPITAPKCKVYSNKPASAEMGLKNKSSFLAATLGVAEVKHFMAINLVTVYSATNLT
jgi:hypothetical protein